MYASICGRVVILLYATKYHHLTRIIALCGLGSNSSSLVLWGGCRTNYTPLSAATLMNKFNEMRHKVYERGLNRVENIVSRIFVDNYHVYWGVWDGMRVPSSWRIREVKLLLKRCMREGVGE